MNQAQIHINTFQFQNLEHSEQPELTANLYKEQRHR